MYNPWTNFYNTGSTYSYLEYIELQKKVQEEMSKTNELKDDLKESGFM